MRIYISLISLLSLVGAIILTPSVGAIPYPSTTPAGEVGSGTFNGYFTNMFNTTGCSGGDVVRGFSPTGILLCTAGGSGTGAEAPIGTISAFNLASCPSGWSPADGTSGTPDLRGEFIRGWDNGRGVDTGRVLATLQSHAVQNGSTIATTGWVYNFSTSAWSSPSVGEDVRTGQKVAWSGNSSTETRPRNVALLYCVKTSAGTPANNTTWGLSGVNVIQASTGSVGIGTASPGAKLEIAGTQDNLLRLNKTSGTTYNYMEWVIAGTRKYWTGIDAAGIYNIQSDSPYTAVAINALGGNVGIGTTTPGAKLEVVGTIKITGGTPGAGKVLTSDASGLASWIAATSSQVCPGSGSSNTCYGINALVTNTTGGYNTANGVSALQYNTVGSSNTANGVSALQSNTAGNYNTANGQSALQSNTTGVSNTANGHSALYTNTTGNNNTADGMYALFSNTTGGYNTSNGMYSLFSNTTGGSNTANGMSTLRSNTTGVQNTADGDSALYANTTGVSNTANGVYSLFSNTTGGYNTANGVQALMYNVTGAGNTAVGFGALWQNLAGYNTAIGNQALYNNTTGIQNTANGAYALAINTTGNRNTANGLQALYSNTVGNHNNANGVSALFNNTIGSANTADGYQALYGNVSGGVNSAHGYQSLYQNNGDANAGYGAFSLGLNTSGGNNTANGIYALGYNTTGSDNTAIGKSAGIFITTGSSNIAIGSNAQVISNTGSSQLSIGNWIYGSGGNIGIGVANPVSKFQVDGEIVSSNIGAGGQFRAVYGNYGSFIRNDGSNTYFLLTASGTPYGGWNGYRPITIGNTDSMVALNQSLYSLNNGNVGIGTTTPTQKLTVYGVVNSQPGVMSLESDRQDAGDVEVGRISGKNAQVESSRIGLYRGGGSNNGFLTFSTKLLNDGSLPLERMRIDSSGNIGIGTTTPGAKFDIAGNIKITDGTQGAGKVLTSDATGLASWITPGAASSVPWSGITGAPAFATNNVSGRVRAADVGCESGWGTSCDANSNGRIDNADNTALAANSTLAGGITPSNFHRNDAAGDWQMASATNSSSYSNAALEVRELNFAGAQTAAVSESPRVAFHWGGRVASQIGMASDGAIRTFDNPGTGYENFAAKNIVANGTVQITGGAPGAGKVLTSDASGLASWQTATSSVTWAGVTAKSLGDTARNDSSLDIGTSQYMRWKNYGNGHIIIDASNGTSPAGGGIDQTNSQVQWAASYPTLMGWNGANTYGVRVDSARAANGAMGTTSSQFMMPDSDESSSGPKSIHANSNVLGFLNGAGSWMVYWDSAGNQQNQGAINAVGSITGNEIFNNGWYRSNGNAGWYSQSYGGGWWMTDPTWIRSYGGKYMYVDSIIQAGAYMNSPAYYYISDARLKKDLVKITSSLDKVTAMNGYYFKWKKDDKKDLGLIAQEVEKIFPDAVGEYTDPDSKKTYKNVEYGHLIAPVIEAIKELATIVKSNKADIVALRSENESLKKRLDAIEARLAK